MTTTPEWTPAHIDQVRALVERLRHELAEHDDGVWVGIGSAIVTLVPSALAELSRLQADNARLRVVVEAARAWARVSLDDPIGGVVQGAELLDVLTAYDNDVARAATGGQP